MIIAADDREKSSGIIDLLIETDIDVVVRRLSCFDYIINGEIGVERKTARDFLVSIVDGRLFRQAKVMKTCLPRPVFLIEGNPFKVEMVFNPESIRGAILSLQVIWYIPVLFSKSMADTCRIFRLLGDQAEVHTTMLTLRHGYRPKKLITRQLHILQGLPNVGPHLAKRMLAHFGTVRRAMQADIESLAKIEGIGKKKAESICNVLDAGRLIAS